MSYQLQLQLFIELLLIISADSQLKFRSSRLCLQATWRYQKTRGAVEKHLPHQHGNTPVLGAESDMYPRFGKQAELVATSLSCLVFGSS